MQSKICIYGLGSNLLRMMSGMAGLAFAIFCGHYTCPFEMDGNYHRRQQPALPALSTIVPVPWTTLRSTILFPAIPAIADIIIYRRIINSDKFICPITQEDIAVNARYMSCVQCNNNFCEESLKHWLGQYRGNTCPICRANWTDRNIYINGENISESETISPLHVLPLITTG